MTGTTITRHGLPRHSANFTHRALQALCETHRRFVTRRELKRLSAFQLRDIGLDPAEATREPASQIDPWTMIDLMSMR